MTRKEELLEFVGNNTALIPLIDDVVYLEEQLDYYRKLPKIRVHPTNSSKQKLTEAAKLYKNYLQSYQNAIKLIMKIVGADEAEEDSPLRKWMREHVDSE